MNPTAVTLQVPAHLVATFKQLAELTTGSGYDQAPVSTSFAETEQKILNNLARIEGECIAAALRCLVPVEDRVIVDGHVWRRLEPAKNHVYFGPRAQMNIVSHIYRREDIRNGPTIRPMELRAGIVGGRYTPATAKALAALAQAMPSREAELVANALGVMPYSRSTYLRSGNELGTLWEELREDLETALAYSTPIPIGAASVSIAVDRVSVPMAEPRQRTAEDDANGIKNPISTVHRMAFVSVTTLHDNEGAPVGSIRHAHTPEGGAKAMEQALAKDLDGILSRRPDLDLVLLSDGAPEMQGIVDRAAGNREVAARITDYYHLIEKLAAAVQSAGHIGAAVLDGWQERLLTDDSAIGQIEGELATWAKSFDAKDIPEELHAAQTYIANRRDRLCYASHRAKGRPIGSGAVEATCKTIATVRMKRPGAGWSVEGAQAILGLRALATSSEARWDAAIKHVIDSGTFEVIPVFGPIRRQVRPRE